MPAVIDSGSMRPILSVKDAALRRPAASHLRGRQQGGLARDENLHVIDARALDFLLGLGAVSVRQ